LPASPATSPPPACPDRRSNSSPPRPSRSARPFAAAHPCLTSSVLSPNVHESSLLSANHKIHWSAESLLQNLDDYPLRKSRLILSQICFAIVTARQLHR